MAYTAFPDYAQFLMDGYSIETFDGASRDQMEDGYTHQAPANSLTRYEASLKYRLASPARKDAFEAWRVGNGQGMLHFAWPDPDSGTIRRARIINGKVNYSPLTKSRVDEWIAAFTVEYFR